MIAHDHKDTVAIKADIPGGRELHRNVERLAGGEVEADRELLAAGAEELVAGRWRVGFGTGGEDAFDGAVGRITHE